MAWDGQNCTQDHAAFATQQIHPIRSLAFFGGQHRFPAATFGAFAASHAGLRVDYRLVPRDELFLMLHLGFEQDMQIRGIHIQIAKDLVLGQMGKSGVNVVLPVPPLPLIMTISRIEDLLDTEFRTNPVPDGAEQRMQFVVQRGDDLSFGISFRYGALKRNFARMGNPFSRPEILHRGIADARAVITTPMGLPMGSNASQASLKS